ncbi:MAG: hypothetical protein WBF56_04915 [Candidatus Acidiferrales bacterium]
MAASDPPETKLRKIYERCQGLRDTSDEELGSEKEMKQANLKANSNVEDVLNHGYASTLETNYLFVGLARTAGFEATIIFLAPRNQDFFYPQLQDPNQVDDDIAWVKAGDKEYFLDPSVRAYPFPLLPWYETMSSGIKVTKQGGQVVTAPNLDAADAVTERRADLRLGNDGAVTGTVKAEFRGQDAAYYRYEYRKEDEGGRKKELSQLVQSWLPGTTTFELTKITDWENNAAPLVIEGTFKVPALGMSAGHRLLVPVTIFAPTYAQEFNPTKRSNGIYFPYPSQHTDDTIYHAPDGYRIESVPPDKPAQTGSAMTYERTGAKQGNTVEIKSTFMQNGVSYGVKYYAAVRAFISSMKSEDSAQIVFEAGNAATGN